MTTLRPCDLLPGRHYISPTGRRCVLVAVPSEKRQMFTFAYIGRDGKRMAVEAGFDLAADAQRAIAGMREA